MPSELPEQIIKLAEVKAVELLSTADELAKGILKTAKTVAKELKVNTVEVTSDSAITSTITEFKDEFKAHSESDREFQERMLEKIAVLPVMHEMIKNLKEQNEKDCGSMLDQVRKTNGKVMKVEKLVYMGLGIIVAIPTFVSIFLLFKK